MIKKILILVLLLSATQVFADTQPVLDKAEDIGTDTTAFNKNLSSTDTDVQKALDTLDNLTISAGGYTNLTEFVTQTNWRLFYSDGSGDVKELGFGASGEFLKSNGTTSAPTWAVPTGGAHDAVTVTDTATLDLTLATQDIKGDVITLKDLVTTAPLTGGTNDILVGADADITIAIPQATTSADGYVVQADWDSWTDHVADNTQAHSDYLINSGDTGTGAYDFTGATVTAADPLTATQVATRQYVDDHVALETQYFTSDTASGVGAYFTMYIADTGQAESTATTTGLGAANDQLLTSWITEAGEPVFQTLLAQIYDVHIHAARTAGNRTCVIYWTLTEYKADTSEVLIMTSEVSSAFTTKIAINLHSSLTSTYTLAATTSRLVLKVYANVSGGSQATTIVLYSEGVSDSHFTIPTEHAVVNEAYVNVTGDAMTGTLTTTGNIGIGTTAPVHPLSVVGQVYVNGNVGIGTTNPTANLYVAGTINLPNNSVTDAMVSDTLTASNLVAGSSVVSDAEVDDNLTISGGTINASTVGAVVKSTGAFTTLEATSTVTLPANSITDTMVSDTLTASDLVAGSSVVADAEVDNNLTISAGTINNTTVGATVANTGAFTTMTATSLTTTGNIGIGTTAPRQKLDVTTIGIFGGNIGIGTTAPTFNLDVQGTGFYDGLLTVYDSIYFTTDLYNANAFTLYTTGPNDDITIDPNSGGTATIQLGVVGDADIIYAAGNVGIGTTAPIQLLHTSGKSYFSDNVGIGTVTPRQKLDVMTIGIFGGNVGIGTTAPTANLDVAGTISLPANSITDAMVSNTLTASDLVAGSAVVADSEVVDALTISGGTINNTAIGGTVTAAGAFTTLGATSTLTFPANSISDAMVSDTLTASDLVSGSAVVADSEVVDTLTISAGTINNTTIGATVANTGGFTTMTATSLTTTGNIGIGTTAPRQRLDNITIGVFGTNVGIGTLTPRNAGDIAGSLNVTGNIGIGTTAPVHPLSVVGATYANGNIGIGTVTTRAPLDVIGLAIVSGNVGIGTVTAANPLVCVGAMQSIGSGNSYFNGNVGIGTTAPVQKCDIVGEIIVNGNMGIGTAATGGRLLVMGGNVGIGSVNPPTALYIIGTVSADTVTDRTPAYMGINALDDLTKVKSKNGKIDHESLPEFLVVDMGNGTKERNIGNTVTMLIEAVKELKSEIDKLTKRVEQLEGVK
jgi:hypothetical protein